MTIPKDNSKLEAARRLRRQMTPQERRLWYTFLRNHSTKVYKQRIIGPFIVDFYCAKARLVIEIDGSQHYENAGKQADADRTAYLESLGLKVIRYSNTDVSCRFREVCESIDRWIRDRSDPLRPA